MTSFNSQKNKYDLYFLFQTRTLKFREVKNLPKTSPPTAEMKSRLQISWSGPLCRDNNIIPSLLFFNSLAIFRSQNTEERSSALPPERKSPLLQSFKFPDVTPFRAATQSPSFRDHVHSRGKFATSSPSSLPKRPLSPHRPMPLLSLCPELGDGVRFPLNEFSTRQNLSSGEKEEVGLRGGSGGG